MSDWMAIAQWHDCRQLERPAVVFEIQNADGQSLFTRCVVPLPPVPFDWKSPPVRFRAVAEQRGWDVVEWQELLNGAQIVTIEGASPDGWTLSASVTWSARDADFAGEGDIALTRGDGAELFGSLTRARVSEIGDAEVVEADHLMQLEYEIDGGSGPFEGASGSARAEGRLSRESFAGTWIVVLGRA